MAAPTGFLKDFRAAALGAIAPDNEQDIDLAANQVVHGDVDIDGAARGI